MEMPGWYFPVVPFLAFGKPDEQMGDHFVMVWRRRPSMSWKEKYIRHP